MAHTKRSDLARASGPHKVRRSPDWSLQLDSMYRNKKVAAIIGAGGSGRRMAAPVPKQFLKIHGRTILEMSVDRFARMTAVDEIIVVVPSGYGDHCRELLGDGVSIVEGGQERQDSIYAAVRLLSQKGLVADDIVLIHGGIQTAPRC